MTTSTTPSTSVNLLEQLRDRRNTAAWERWVALYTPLMRLWLRSASLQAADVDDVTQRVLAVVVNKVPNFAHNGRAGAFRAWLRTIMVNELRAFSRDRNWSDDSMLDQFIDPNSDLNRWWDREHDRQMLRELLELVRPEFTPTTWQAFRGTVIDEKRTEAVASELGLSENAVLIAKSRVLGRLRGAARVARRECLIFFRFFVKGMRRRWRFLVEEETSVTPEGDKHPSADVLRAYGQGRLDPGQAARIEQHLLVCTQCCEILKTVPPDSFIELVRETQPGASHRHAVSARPTPPAPSVPSVRGRWLPWILGILGLLALGTVVLIVLKRPG